VSCLCHDGCAWQVLTRGCSEFAPAYLRYMMNAAVNVRAGSMSKLKCVLADRPAAGLSDAARQDCRRVQPQDQAGRRRHAPQDEHHAARESVDWQGGEASRSVPRG
jgi:hypothetical protein